MIIRSELSELIEINKNIEKQNKEIIRLLKKITDEDKASDNEKIEKDPEITPLDVGEVYFAGSDVFRLTTKNNDLNIDNLTGVSECHDFKLASIIANKSCELNQILDDTSVILTDESKGNLPQTLNHCIKIGFKKAYIPWNQMSELINAPQELQFLLKLDFYKNNSELIEKLFSITK